MANLLIVDDSIFMRNMLAKILSEAGHRVIGEASNGLEAVEGYRKLRPDLVTMDITMTEMGGIEAVQRIITIDPTAKIIMCSAMGQQRLVIEAMQAGACDFIVKPFSKKRVIEAVDKLISMD